MPPNVYATLQDLDHQGIASEALGEIDPDRKLKVLASVSRTIDGFLAAQFKLPLIRWGEDVTVVCCQIASFRLLANRGFSPEGVDQMIVKMHDDAMDLLKIWSRDDGAVPDVLDSSANAVEQQPSARPSVTSSPSRGWTGNGVSGGRSSCGVPFSGGNR